MLPTTALGQDYTVVSHRPIYDQWGDGYSYISVIATDKPTTVTIRKPNGTPVAGNINIPAGQTYLYCTRAIHNTEAERAATDLTGYTVEADENVAVFSGVGCGIEVVHGACDHNYEQLWPTYTAGKHYLVWSMSGIYDDLIKVLALSDNTTITKKEGNTTSTISLAKKHDVKSFFVKASESATPYANGSPLPVWLSSDKPFVVEHLMGWAPTIKWISPVEQMITHAFISPFALHTTITRHQLHLIIPAGTENDLTVTYRRGSVVTPKTFTFYTNTSNPSYVIATDAYDADDDVLIEVTNPAGFLAYMTGTGGNESYIVSAGAAAFDLKTYFTVATASEPFKDVHYTVTEEATHTFVSSDTMLINRTVEQSFDSVQWLVSKEKYAGASDNTAETSTLKIPASLLKPGENELTMSIRYTGSSQYHDYTGKVWLSPVKINIQKDGTAWSNHGKTFSLRQNGVKKYEGTAIGSAVKFDGDVTSDAYQIYDGNVSTGLTVTLSGSSEATATVSYYTLQFKAQDAGLANASAVNARYNGVAVADGYIALAGGKLELTAVGKGAETYRYSWSGAGVDKDSSTIAIDAVNAKTDVTATVTGKQTYTLVVLRDGAAWSNHGKTFSLKKSGTEYKVEDCDSSAVVFPNISNPGAYALYDGATPAGKTVTLPGAVVRDTLRYYTVALVAGAAGLATAAAVTATYGGDTIRTDTVVPGGKLLTLAASGEGAKRYGYAWTGAGVAGKTTAAVTITRLAAKVSDAATVTGYTDVALVVRKNGQAWDAHGKTFTLRTPDGVTTKYTGAGVNSTVMFDTISEAGSFALYDGDDSTGATITVDPPATAADTLNYYSLAVNALPVGAATAVSPSGVYLAGKQVPLTVAPVANAKLKRWTASRAGAGAFAPSDSLVAATFTMPPTADTVTALLMLRELTVTTPAAARVDTGQSDTIGVTTSVSTADDDGNSVCVLWLRETLNGRPASPAASSAEFNAKYAGAAEGDRGAFDNAATAGIPANQNARYWVCGVLISGKTTDSIITFTDVRNIYTPFPVQVQHVVTDTGMPQDTVLAHYAPVNANSGLPAAIPYDLGDTAVLQSPSLGYDTVTLTGLSAYSGYYKWTAPGESSAGVAHKLALNTAFLTDTICDQNNLHRYTVGYTRNSSSWKIVRAYIVDKGGDPLPEIIGGSTGDPDTVLLHVPVTEADSVTAFHAQKGYFKLPDGSYSFLPPEDTSNNNYLPRGWYVATAGQSITDVAQSSPPYVAQPNFGDFDPKLKLTGSAGTDGAYDLDGSNKLYIVYTSNDHKRIFESYYLYDAEKTGDDRLTTQQLRSTTSTIVATDSGYSRQAKAGTVPGYVCVGYSILNSDGSTYKDFTQPDLSGIPADTSIADAVSVTILPGDLETDMTVNFYYAPAASGAPGIPQHMAFYVTVRWLHFGTSGSDATATDLLPPQVHTLRANDSTWYFSIAGGASGAGSPTDYCYDKMYNYDTAYYKKDVAETAGNADDRWLFVTCSDNIGVPLRTAGGYGYIAFGYAYSTYGVFPDYEQYVDEYYSLLKGLPAGELIPTTREPSLMGDKYVDTAPAIAGYVAVGWYHGYFTGGAFDTAYAAADTAVINPPRTATADSVTFIYLLADGDEDGDGLTNGDEIAKGTNPFNPDTDGDGLPDGWEVKYGLDPNDPTDDNGANGDPDDDGLTNEKEHEYGADPHNPDTDGDDLPDGWEVQHNLDPTNPDGDDGADGDPDHDGLTNREEYEKGTDPKNPDTDGDGCPDGWEASHGYNPTYPEFDPNDTGATVAFLNPADTSGGATAPVSAEDARYTAPCGADSIDVYVIPHHPFAGVWHNGAELCCLDTGTTSGALGGYAFSVPLGRPGFVESKFAVKAPAGGEPHEYTVAIENRYRFEDVVEQKWDNTLVVVDKTEDRFGYRFVGYQWYCDSLPVQGATEQYLSVGEHFTSNAADRLDESKTYYVEFTLPDGQKLHTCPGHPTLKIYVGDLKAKAYPNPASTELTVESAQLKAGDKLELFSVTGVRVRQYKASGSTTIINLSGLPEGEYILRAGGASVKLAVIH